MPMRHWLKMTNSMHKQQSIYISFGKRLFDVFVSSVALILFLPLLALLAIVVRLMLGAPVLFRQVRPGLHHRPFTIFKFRTMRDEYDAAGEMLPDSIRMTRLGSLLRSTSLDELPELFNVLKGEMSLVGPRPLLPRYQPWYTARELRRFDLRPGITGWAQINGRNALGWDERFQHDVHYVENCSLLLDIRILFLTVGKVLRRDDVHVDTTFTEGALDDVRREAQAGSSGSR